MSVLDQLDTYMYINVDIMFTTAVPFY